MWSEAARMGVAIGRLPQSPGSDGYIQTMKKAGVRSNLVRTSVERAKQNLLLFLRRRGFELSKLNEAPHFATLMQILSSHELSTVVDVGANEGQFGRGIREAGFTGHIVSLEPLGGPFRRLSAEASKDPAWSVLNAALATDSGEHVMTVASNLGMSSSFLEMTELHKRHAPGSVDDGTEVVRTIDWGELAEELPDGRVFLKLDLQGYEGQVLRDPAAAAVVDRAGGVLVELSCSELYKGAWTPGECISFMEDQGFEIFSLSPEWFDRSSLRLLQFNAVFVRKDDASTSA